MPMARLSAVAHRQVQDLAARRGVSQQEFLDYAVELAARKQFYEDAHREYEALQADRGARAELDAERAVLDGGLDDGAID